MDYSSNLRGNPGGSNNLWIGNNYSSGGYGSMPRGGYPQQQQQHQQMMAQPQTMNNILQVMGPESAQAWQVGPNSHIILMDSNRPVFYVKRSDDSGYSETKAFRFEEIPLFQNEQQNDQLTQNMNDFVTKTEFNEFKNLMEDLVMRNNE